MEDFPQKKKSKMEERTAVLAKYMGVEMPKSPYEGSSERQESAGFGFELGLTFGTAYNFVKGFISSSSSSSSIKSRLMTAASFARSRCIPTCGIVAGLFMVAQPVETAVTYYRQKLDPFNTFVSFTASAAVVGAVHSGFGVVKQRGPVFCTAAVLGCGGFFAVTHYLGDRFVYMRLKQIEMDKKNEEIEMEKKNKKLNEEKDGNNNLINTNDTP